MMKVYTIRIELDNAAFEDDPAELSRLLYLVADHSSCRAPYEGTFQDYNGNTVGSAKVINSRRRP